MKTRSCARQSAACSQCSGQGLCDHRADGSLHRRGAGGDVHVLSWAAQDEGCHLGRGSSNGCLQHMRHGSGRTMALQGCLRLGARRYEWLRAAMHSFLPCVPPLSLPETHPHDLDGHRTGPGSAASESCIGKRFCISLPAREGGSAARPRLSAHHTVPGCDGCTAMPLPCRRRTAFFSAWYRTIQTP